MTGERRFGRRCDTGQARVRILDFAFENGYSPVRKRGVGESLYRADMESEPKRITITIGGVSVEAELKPTRTAAGIYEALPVEAALNQWGEEVYCRIPEVKDHRETATTNVKVGDVALWGPGGMLAVFLGPTPMSIGEDPVPADRVNVVGRLLGDPGAFRQATGATMMKIEKKV